MTRFDKIFWDLATISCDLARNSQSSQKKKKKKKKKIEKKKKKKKKKEHNITPIEHTWTTLGFRGSVHECSDLDSSRSKTSSQVCYLVLGLSPRRTSRVLPTRSPRRPVLMLTLPPHLPLCLPKKQVRCWMVCEPVPLSGDSNSREEQPFHPPTKRATGPQRGSVPPPSLCCPNDRG
jgi:hypothetical protein